jgi:hypothetical protein
MREIQISIVATTVVILLAQLLRRLWMKPQILVDWAIIAELLFCFLRNLSILLEITLRNVNCEILVKTGFSFYILWIVSMDTVLMLRTRRFTVYPRVFAAITFLCLAGFVTVNAFLTASIVVLNEPHENCKTFADFPTFSSYSYYTRFALEVILLLPFLAKAVQSYLAIKDDSQAKMWLRLSLTNCQVSVSLLLIEFVLVRISENPEFFPWLSTLFSIGNCIEGNLVLFLMEDTKKTLQRKTQVAKSKESALIPPQSSKPLESM